MMLDGQLVSAALLALLAFLLIFSSLRKLPGIGMIPAILIISFVVWQRGDGLATLGLIEPDSWINTIGLSLFSGILIALASAAVIEPLSERWTGTAHDLSALGAIRSDLRATVAWIVAAWLLAATLEEIIFRGYFMNELSRLLGTGIAANLFNILSTSALFGLAHWYQSRAGALSTGIVSLFLGSLFIWNDFNLWLLILTHGVIDTLGLTLIYLGWDKRLKNSVEHVSDHSRDNGP